MQEFEDFREMEGTRNTYIIKKRHIYVSFANWRRKMVSFETYSAFFYTVPNK